MSYKRYNLGNKQKYKIISNETPCDSSFQGQQRLNRMFVTKTRDEVIYCGSCISEKMWIILQEMGDISQAIAIKCQRPGLTSTRPYILTSLM